MQESKVKFEATLITSGATAAVWHFLPVPRETVAPLGFTGNLRRVVCTLNGVETFNTSLFPSKGSYFISINKKLRDRLGLSVGDSVSVELVKDESKYGMPMPEEFAEVLRQDPEAYRHFNALTPGNQRLILKFIVMVSDVDKRIYRALVTIKYLKDTDGKFVYDELYDSLKRPLF